jgi:hypothetical protein
MPEIQRAYERMNAEVLPFLARPLLRVLRAWLFLRSLPIFELEIWASGIHRGREKIRVRSYGIGDGWVRGALLPP